MIEEVIQAVLPQASSVRALGQSTFARSLSADFYRVTRNYICPSAVRNLKVGATWLRKPFAILRVRSRVHQRGCQGEQHLLHGPYVRDFCFLKFRRSIEVTGIWLLTCYSVEGRGKGEKARQKKD